VRLIDSHAHLDFDDFSGDLEGIRVRAQASGVARVVAIGLWRKDGDFGNALELAGSWPGFYSATIGIHPHECARVGEAD
jgi:TatD DNase family protein